MEKFKKRGERREDFMRALEKAGKLEEPKKFEMPLEKEVEYRDEEDLLELGRRHHMLDNYDSEKETLNAYCVRHEIELVP